VSALHFTIPGPPVPNERARKGRGGRYYTPARTRSYRIHVANWARLAVARWAYLHGEKWPTNARYEVTVRSFFPDRRRRDQDNVRKTIQDACSGIIWDDDCFAVIPKSHDDATVDRDNPRAEVTVTLLAPEPVEPKPKARKPRASKGE
jgi:Holliday junction resolvase RusA-like endonuclease